MSNVAENQYLAFFEILNDEDLSSNGEMGESVQCLIEAIPTALLAEQSQFQGETSPIEYLLLGVTREEVQKSNLRLYLENLPYFLISIYPERPGQGVDGRWFRATALDFGADVAEGRTFYIRIENVSYVPESVLEAYEKLPVVGRVLSERSRVTSDLRNRLGEAVTAGAYDVGQANFCSIISTYGHPLLFVDAGWPLPFNRKTLGPHHRYFDPFSGRFQKAPVVLTHFDLDHWGFAIESGRATYDKRGYWKSTPVYRPTAFTRPWITPVPEIKRHRLGPSHVNFLQNLSLHKVLYHIPSRLRKFVIGPLEIYHGRANKAFSKPSELRNNEGLIVRFSVQGSRWGILLPGDADYSSIPKNAMTKLCGVVAPHHGGEVIPGHMPHPVPIGEHGWPRMVFSCSAGAYKSIPSRNTVTEATSKGWTIYRTDLRNRCNHPMDARGRGLECGNTLAGIYPIAGCKCSAVPTSCICLNFSTHFVPTMVAPL